MTPETLAAMLDDDELSTRAAELADDLRRLDHLVRTSPPSQERTADEGAFRAAWRALHVIRAEQRRRA